MPRRTVRYRVRVSGPRERLELDAGKLARPVLRGRGGSNAALLPDQTLETKARFIAQVMTGESGVRRAEDIGGQELSYAEVKAIASGNPAVLILAEAEAELQRLAVLKRNHLDEQFVARRNVRDLPGNITRLAERLAKLTADKATVTACAADPITIGRRTCAQEDAPGLLARHLDSLPQDNRDTRHVTLGIYRGLRFGLALHPPFPPEVFLEGSVMRQAMLSREHQGPRAILNALERLAGSYADECDRLRQDLAIAESQYRDYQARLGQLFPHDHVLSELTALREQLKACLSGTKPELDKELQRSVAELAERFQALKAANTTVAVPERTTQRSSAAEEPVTARIRRHIAATLGIVRTDEPERDAGAGGATVRTQPTPSAPAITTLG
jgi:hypothetical protein